MLNRNVSDGPVEFPTTHHHQGFSDAHNIFIHEETGYAYIVGSSACNQGMYIMDLSNPAVPEPAGCFSEDGYVHDVECRLPLHVFVCVVVFVALDSHNILDLDTVKVSSIMVLIKTIPVGRFASRKCVTTFLIC